MPTSAAASIESREVLIVQLGTPISQANAAAVASTIQAIIAIIEEAQNQTKSTEQSELTERIILKARPFKESSLEIPMELVIVGVALFSHHPMIVYVLECLKLYIATRKLAQKLIPAPETPAAPVTTPGIVIGNVTNSVVNILNNVQVTQAVDKAAVDIEADETIQTVRLLKGESREPLEIISRAELKKFRQEENKAADSLPTRETTQEAVVVIHTPVLEGNAKWKVIYGGKTISVSMNDAEFLREVETGKEAFRAGDRLEVKIIVLEEFSPLYDTFVDSGKSYQITKVVKHFKRPKDETKKLFD